MPALAYTLKGGTMFGNDFDIDFRRHRRLMNVFFMITLFFIVVVLGGVSALIYTLLKFFGVF